MPENYSLDTTLPDPGGESFSVDTSSERVATPLTPQIAQQRAAKVMIGMPGFTDYESALKSINDGTEVQLRNQASMFTDMQKLQQRQSAISHFVKMKGTNLDKEETGFVDKLINRPPNTRPETVFEENYSSVLLNGLKEAATRNPDSWWNEAYQLVPKTMEKSMAIGSDLKTKQQHADNLDEKANRAAQEQGYVGAGIDMIKNFTYLYKVLKLSDMSERGALLVGSSLDKQVGKMYRLPNDEFVKKTTEIVDRLIKDNPSAAVAFTKALKGQTYADKLFEDIDAVTNVMGLGNAAKIGMPTLKTIQASNAIKSAVKQTVQTVDAPRFLLPAEIDAAGRNFPKQITTQEGPRLMLPAEIGRAQEGLNPARLMTQEEIGTAKGAMPIKGEAGPRLMFPSEIDKAQRGLANAGRMPIEQILRARQGVEQLTKDTSVLNKDWTVNTEELNGVLTQPKHDPVSPSAISEAVGDPKRAGLQQATRELGNSLAGTGNPIRNSIESLQQAFSNTVSDLTKNPGRLGQETVNRIIEKTQQLSTSFSEAVMNNMKVERLPFMLSVQKEAQKILENHVEGYYPGLENHIMNIGVRKDPVDNVYYPMFVMGKSGTEQFGSYPLARNFILNNRLTKLAEVVRTDTGEVVTKGVFQKGIGYHVVLTSKAVTETDPIIRHLVETNLEKTPGNILSVWNARLGTGITPNETLSLENSLNREVATYGTNNYYELIKEHNKPIQQLRGFYGTKKREVWNEWQQVTQDIRKAREVDPITGQLLKGTEVIRNPADLDRWYQNIHQRNPSEQETEAFYAFKRLEELKNAWKDQTAHTLKLREGAQTHTVYTLKYTPDKSGNTSSIGHTFDGSRIDPSDLPKQGHSVLVMGKQQGQERIMQALDIRTLEALQNGTATAFKVSRPHEMPLANVSERAAQTMPEYVVSHPDLGHISEPLRFRKLPRETPDFDYEHFTVQPEMIHDAVTDKHIFLRDKTLSAHVVGEEARTFTKNLNEIRIALQKEDLAGAQAAHAKSGMYQSFSDVQKWFTPDIVGSEGTVVPPKFRLDIPFHAVPRGKLSIETSKVLREQFGTKFRDMSSEGYGRFFEGKTDPYDVFTMTNEGTKQNPVFKTAPVKYISPVQSINRALNRVVDQAFMVDYKVFSVEHWVQEAKELMAASKEDILQSPYYHFFNPTPLAGLSAQDTARWNTLMTAHYQIKQFLGIQDTTSSFLHSATQKLSDSLYAKDFTKLALVPGWLLPKVRDPASFVRSLTFHATMGLFAPAQIMVQLQSWATISGIAGAKYAAPGAKASLMHMWARFSSDPNIIAKLDEMATHQLIPGSSRWKSGEFTEARNLLKRFGFEHVGSEYANLDSYLKNDLVGNEARQFLDWGTVFFRESEKNIRAGAWYTAYREFRDANAVGAISEAQARGIMNRADLLYTNMSRASTSSFGKGILSIPTQFLHYQLRLAELMLGKRLTAVERTRLFTTYGALYGIPAATGLTGLPGADYINKWSQEGGYVNATKDSNMLQWANSAVTQGLPATLIALSTGNWYNIPERYAPTGFQQLRDVMRSDKTVWDIFGGATYGKGKQIWDNLDGFTSAMRSWINNDGDFKLKAEDLVAPFKAVSAVNAVVKLKMALETGRWMNSNEGYLGDVALMTGLGLNPQEASGMYTKQWTMAEEKEMENKAVKEAVVEMHRGFRAIQDNNQDQANDYFRRAKTILVRSGYPIEKYGQFISIAAKGNETLINSSNYDYYLRAVPTTRKPQAIPSFLQTLQGQK